MRELCGWIDLGPHSLFAWVGEPDDGLVRGGVVVASSFGREAVPLVGLWRKMASELADVGLVTVRVDYCGTGDSTGDITQPQDVSRWANDILQVTRWLRSGGVPRVAGVAMRLGTAVLGEAARLGAEFDQLVLWDPSVSGRHWIRENRALGMLHDNSKIRSSLRDVNDEYPLEPAVASVMSAWRTWTPSDVWSPTLVLHRPERPLDDDITNRWLSGGVIIADALGQVDLLDVDTLELKWPDETLSRVVKHLSNVGEDAQPWSRPSLLSAIKMPTPAGLIEEEVFRLGARQLLAVESRLPETSTSETPIVIFVADGYHNHWGPARSWVTLGREFASRGIRCVRFDFSRMIGNGEPGAEGLRLYVPEWRDDLAEILRTLGVPGSAAIYVTFCSGALEGVLVANDVGAAGLFAINPPVGLDSFPFILGLLASDRQWLRKLGSRLRAFMLRSRWRWTWLWFVTQWVLPRSRRRNQFGLLASGRARVRVISCDEDRTPFSHRARLRRWGALRIDSPRGYSVRVIEGLDHSMRQVEARATVLKDLEDFVMAVASSKQFEGVGERVQ